MQSFNVAGQGPFPVTIEDFPCRNGLLPEETYNLLLTILKRSISLHRNSKSIWTEDILHKSFCPKKRYEFVR